MKYTHDYIINVSKEIKSKSKIQNPNPLSIAVLVVVVVVQGLNKYSVTLFFLVDDVDGF